MQKRAVMISTAFRTLSEAGLAPLEAFAHVLEHTLAHDAISAVFVLVGVVVVQYVANALLLVGGGRFVSTAVSVPLLRYS